MDIQNGTLSDERIHDLSAVYLAFLSPSLIGSSSVLVVSIARRRHLQQQVLPLVQLALADLLAVLILMFTSVMNFYHDSWFYKNGICQLALPLSLTFYFVSFLLVGVYAWKSMKYSMGGWRTQEENVRQEAQCRMRTFAIPVYAIVWLLPITLYMIYVLSNVLLTKQRLVPMQHRIDCSRRCILFLHSWHHEDPCQSYEEHNLHDIFVYTFLFPAVISVLLCCSVIYYKVGRWYHRHTEEQSFFPVEGDGRSRRSLNAMISTTRKMMAVIIICWAPALGAIALSVVTAKFTVQPSVLFAFYVIQAISMSLHGFLNSIVYAWRRANFTEAVRGEGTPLVHDRQPFYDDSLPMTPP